MTSLRRLPVLKAGIIGLGVSGTMIAEALQFMGAEVSYFSRTRKPEKEAAGFAYRPLKELLAESQVVFACLNKNVILLHKEEFDALGKGKLLFNTSIGRLMRWRRWQNGWIMRAVFYLRSSQEPLEIQKALKDHPNVICAGVSAGRTRQAFGLLSKKVLDNIETCLRGMEA